MSVGDYLLGVGIVINAVITVIVLRRTQGLVDTIQVLEKNTNSIKDALIKATAESEFAKGLLEGKAFAKPSGPMNDPDS